ncbi:MAG: M16 family metallopeptidase [Candidatus Dormibacteria bacterium]
MGERVAEWEMQTLPSGARVILAPLPGRNSVSVSLLLGVGSRSEPKRLAGVSHFLEHIVFKGTERYADSRAVSEAIEGLGGILNASTDKEMTVYWARVPAARLDIAVDVLTDLAFAPTIDPEEVDKERKVVIEELGMYLDQPAELVQMAFDQLIWGDHPLARDPGGTRASLVRVGAAELSGYRTAFYRPDRLVVVVAGAVESKAAQSLLQRRLEPVLRGLPPAAPVVAAQLPPAPAPAELAVRLRRRRGEQTHLLLGARCSSYLAPDRWALDVLDTILGEGMSSRLFLELRERQGLAYDVHSFTSRHRDSGALGIYMATQPEQAATALTAAIVEFRKLANERLGAADLERTKAQIEGRLLLQMESAGALSEFLGQQELLIGEILAPEEVIERVRGVTADQVREVAAALLEAGGWRVAGVGPGAGQDRLQEAAAAALTQ